MMIGRKPLLRPKSVPIATLLLGGVGTLVTISLIVVLATGFLAAGRNTTDLLREQATELMQVTVQRIETHIEPAAIHAELVARMIVEEQFDFRSADIDRIRLTMRALPQIRGTGIFLEDGRSIRITRDGLVLRGTWEDVRMNEAQYRAIIEPKGLVWTDPVRETELGETIIVARHAIIEDSEAVGFVASVISAAELSEFLSGISDDIVRAFLLDSNRRIIAHPALADSTDNFLVRGSALPTAHEIDDGVIHSWISGSHIEATLLGELEGMDTAIVNYGEEEHVLINAPLQAVAPREWTVGVAVSTETADVLFTRLFGILLAGVVVLAMTLFLLWRIARSVRRPVAALAAASERIRTLDLDNIPEPPDTTVAELRDASQAFHRMVGALRWFETYVPRRLVKRLMEASDGEGIPTRTREMTLMFTDIVGFTTLSESLGADETAGLLNQHFSMIAKCVEAEDGTIDKYIGDCVMAFWGAPSRQEDHAERACRAVRAIAQAVRAHNAERAQEGKPPIRMRIGLHSGKVVVGNIGAPGRVNYTVVGDPVNVANRIEQLGKEVDADTDIIILASEATIAAAGHLSGHEIEGATPVGERTLRGLSATVGVWRLDG